MLLDFSRVPPATNGITDVEQLIMGKFLAVGLNGVHNVRTSTALVARALSKPTDDTPVEWTRWVHRLSPNARSVWRSQFPPLVLKSMWYSLSVRDICCDIRSLMWGMGYHGYPKQWWQPKLYAMWRKYRLDRCFSMHQADRWVAEGATISESQTLGTMG